MNYKYKVDYTNDFKKDYKRIKKQGKQLHKLQEIINILATGKIVDSKYKNHKLTSSKKYKNYFELHIEPDWLLVYRFIENELILILIATGSHSELF